MPCPQGARSGVLWLHNQGGRSCRLTIENLPLRDSGEVLDHLLDNVFGEFQFDKRYHIPVGPRERVRLRVRFCPRGELGPRQESFLFRFDEAPPQVVTIRAVLSPCPVMVTPLQLNLGACLSDHHVLQQNFYVTNTRRTPVSVSTHAQGLTVIPSQALVQPGHTLPFCVRLLTSQEGELRLPVAVRAEEHTTVVTVCASSSARKAISLSPQRVDLGVVTSAETVSFPLELRNNTCAVRKFGFLDLPGGVRVQPGFGTLLPEETLAVQVVYSPDKSQDLRLTCHTRSGATTTAHCVARVIGTQCGFVPSHVAFPDTPCGSHSVVRAKLRALQTTKFELKSPSSELLVTPQSGHLSRHQEICVLLVLRPEREGQRAEILTCVTEAAWLQVTVITAVIVIHVEIKM